MQMATEMTNNANVKIEDMNGLGRVITFASVQGRYICSALILTFMNEIAGIQKYHSLTFRIKPGVLPESTE